jgi:hypothetical protein
VERGQENEGALNGLVLQNILASGTDFPRVDGSSPPTPMPVKYLAKIWESPGAGGAASEGDRKVQDDFGAVIGPNTIYSIMEFMQDPNYRPPPSGAPTKLFICCGQYS